MKRLLKYLERKFSLILFLSLIFSSTTLIISCKKYPSQKQFFEEYELPPTNTMKRKVLLISLDGAVGHLVKEVMPQNIKSLLAQGKYSFWSVTDVVSNDPSSLTTLMTGQSSARHAVVDDTYRPAMGEDFHEAVDNPISFMNRIESQSSNFNTVGITQLAGLANNLLIDADETILLDTDLAVKDKALDFLSKLDPDVLFLQFRDILRAGTAYGFSNNEQYKKAIESVDTYIGQILAELRKRESYEQEDWLVIVSSNQGGIHNTYGGYSENERNTFQIYANPKFESKEFPKYTLSNRFYGHWTLTDKFHAAYIPNVDAQKNFNLSEDAKELTIQAKVKFNTVSGGNNNAALISKKDRYALSGSSGWGIYNYGLEGLRFHLSDALTFEDVTLPKRSNGQWGVITARVKSITDKPEALELSIFLDGQLIEKKNTPKMNMQNLKTNASDLIIGQYKSTATTGYSDFDLAFARIWNKALTDEEIKTSSCLATVKHEGYATSLLGEWQVQNYENNKYINSLADGYNFITANQIVKPGFSENFSPCTNNGGFYTALSNKDIAPQIYYWLNIAIPVNWKIEGKQFLNQYELEFLK